MKRRSLSFGEGEGACLPAKAGVRLKKSLLLKTFSKYKK
jgi:hypothetical protein